MKEKFNNWYYTFFSGRYGTDQLSSFILLLGIGAILISRFTGFTYFYIFYWACMLVWIYRLCSKQIQKRRYENTRFMSAAGYIPSKCRLYFRIAKEFRTHKYLRCPGCKQWLRFPKGKGEIDINCSQCHKKFSGKV